MRNKCKSFLKRFLCLTLALVVAMTSSGLDVLAVPTGGDVGSGSITGSHVKNYIGKGIMGYRMYLVENSHKQVVKGKKTKDGTKKVLGASNYLLSYNRKKTKKPYKLLTKYYYKNSMIKSKIFYSMGKKNVAVIDKGLKGRGKANTGSLMQSVMKNLENNNIVKKREEKVNISFSFGNTLGSLGSNDSLDFSTKKVNGNTKTNANEVFGSGANISFTNYGGGKGMTAKFGNGGGSTTLSIRDDQRAVVPAAEIRFLVKTFNKLLGSGSNEHSNDVKYVIIKQMLLKSGKTMKDLRYEASNDKCGKLRTYLLNHYSIIVEPVVTLMRDNKKLTISYQDFKRKPSTIDKDFYIGNQLRAIVGNMGLYGTIEIGHKKKDISNAYTNASAKGNLMNNKSIPYGYGIFRGCADMGGRDSGKELTLTRTVTPEITVSASVSTIGRSINAIGSYVDDTGKLIGKDTQSKQYLLLKMHRVDFVDLSWDTTDGNAGHVIAKITDRGNFISIIPLDKLDEVYNDKVRQHLDNANESNDIEYNMNANNDDWKVTKFTDEDGNESYNVNGVAKDTNFFALCEALTTECISNKGRVYTASDTYATVSFNDSVPLCQVNVDGIVFKDGSGTDITDRVKGACGEVFNLERLTTISASYEDEATKSIKVEGTTTLLDDAEVYAYDGITVDGDSNNIKVAFNDITDAYTGVYLGFGNNSAKGNKVKAKLTEFKDNELDRLLYNVNNYNNNQDPLVNVVLTQENAKALDYFNDSLALDSYLGLNDGNSVVNTGLWHPSYMSDSLRALFSYTDEANFVDVKQYQADVTGVGSVLAYDSTADYKYAQHNEFTARFTSVSTLMGALYSSAFRNAYSGDGIEIQSVKDVDIGVRHKFVDSNSAENATTGNTNTRSKSAQEALETGYVESSPCYQDTYRSANLLELANTNTAKGCEDAVLRVAQSNAADACINLQDHFTYVAEVENGGTAGDYNDDNLFGQGADEGSDIQPFYIKLTVSQNTCKLLCGGCADTSTFSTGDGNSLKHICHYQLNGVEKKDVDLEDKTPDHNEEGAPYIRHSNFYDGSSRIDNYLCRSYSYKAYARVGNDFAVVGSRGTKSYDGDVENKKEEFKKGVKECVNSALYTNLNIDTVKGTDHVTFKDTGYGVRGAKYDSKTFYIAVTAKEDGDNFVARLYSDEGDAKDAIKEESTIEADDDDDSDDDFSDEDEPDSMITDDGTEDANIDGVDSYISPDDSNNPEKTHMGTGLGRNTEVHSNLYYEKMENGRDADANGTGGYGSTPNKRISTRVSVYDKLYMYDENITDDVNYLVFKRNGKEEKNGAQFTYLSDKSIVNEIEVTKSLGNDYLHTYSSSELPSENLVDSQDNNNLKTRVDKLINDKGMKLEYIFAVPRVLTRRLKGSKQWVENTCNIPALTKETEPRVSLDSFTSKKYGNRNELSSSFMKSLSNGDFGISGYDAKPFFNAEGNTGIASTVFTVASWVGSDELAYNRRSVALTSGQLKGYSIYYIYSYVDNDGGDPSYKTVNGKVALKEYELNRVYDSIQNLTELHNNPLTFKRQVNFADADFTSSINTFDVDVYSVNGVSGKDSVVKSDSYGSHKYDCIIGSKHSGILSPSYVASSGIGGSINALNTSYKVIDTSTGTLTDANLDVSNFSCSDLSDGNKYVLQTVNWFKQGVLRDGLNINSALPFVPDYSINLSRHFFGDTRVLSGITSCDDYNSSTATWLSTLLKLEVGFVPTNSNDVVNLGMNDTTASKTVKLGDGTFGKQCSDAFRLTAGWADGLNDNTDLDAKKSNRVVEVLNAYHYDYSFMFSNYNSNSDDNKPNNDTRTVRQDGVLIPSNTDKNAGVDSVNALAGSQSTTYEDKDNMDSSLRFIEYKDVNGGTATIADILHRHDYHLAQLGRPAGTIFHVDNILDSKGNTINESTTYNGVVINITEYAFRYNTKYQGNKNNAFASNTETPKNGILEFSNKTGAKLDGVEISSGSKVTNNKLGNLNGYAYGYVNSVAKRNSDDIRMKFYPEVEMLAYSYGNSMYGYGASIKSLYNIDRIPDTQAQVNNMNSNSIYSGDTSPLQGWVGYLKLLTIGEELRKANSSELYVLSVKKGRKEGSFVDSDIKGKIASDGLAAGVGDAVSVGIGVGDLPTIYAGSDVVLQADSDFTINMAGYALDLINDDDEPIYEYKDESGNKSLKTHTYQEIVSGDKDIYTLWGNKTVGGKNEVLLYENFRAWVKTNAVPEKFKVDAKLKVSNNVYSNFNISVGSVKPLTASDKRESISSNSYNVNAYTKKEYATGAYDIIKGKGILDKFALNKNTAETGCYQIKVSHGKIEKDDGGYIAMIKQLAVDYDFAKDYWSVDDEAYKKAEKIFEASGIYSSIFEAIESDNDESNKSCRVATYERDEDGNPVKKDGKLVYKEDCYDERGNNIGVDVSNEDILGNDEHWYDERVYTMVIRRFESRPFYLKDITLSDKVDYANATTNTKIHSQLKDANVGKWYFTVYLGERDKSNTPFADYRETNNNYCGEGKIFPEISFFNPEAKNRQSSLNNAKSSGTVIMEDVWVDGADFRVPDATTGDMTAY